MAYGTVKVDNITFDNGGSDQNVTVSGLYRATTSGVTVSGTIAATTVSGVTVIGSTTVSGDTVTGTTANFTSGNFSNIISSAATMSGALIMANQQQVQFRESGGTNHIALRAPTSITNDQIITLPEQTGTLITTGDNGSVSSTMLATNLTISAAAGSASTPSIAFTGDLNTGIYSPGADQLAVSTGGTGRLFIDSLGRVGIGTSSPNTTLHVYGGNLKVQQGASLSDVSELTLSSAYRTGRILSGYTNPVSVTETYIAFHTNRTGEANDTVGEAMRIAGGNVGIGTSSPGVKLHVVGSAGTNFGVSDGSAYGLRIDNGIAYGLTGSTIHGVDQTFFGSYQPLTLNGSQLGFAIGGTERLRIDSSGNVGIGTVSPGTALDVRFPTNPSTNNGGGFNTLRCWTSSALAADSGGAISLGGTVVTTGEGASFGQIAGRKDNATSASYGGYLQFATNDANGTMGERLRIDSSGRLLVGTSSASGGYLNNNSLVHVQAEGPSAGITIHRPTTFSALAGPYLLFSRSRGTPAVIVNSGDNLGSIEWGGADGTDVESVAAAIRAEVDGTPGANDMPGRLVFSTTADGSANPTERLRIDSSGRVGIGTSSPASTLHVNGGDIIIQTDDPGNRLIRTSFAGGAIQLRGSSSTTDRGLRFGAISNNDVFSEMARIDDAGRLLVGTSTSVTTGGLLQVVGGDTARPVIHRNINDQYPAILYLSKARGTGNQIVSNGDALGTIVFIGADGSQVHAAGFIECQVDGTPGANDMPGRLVFFTTADGASSPTERMRITNNGRVYIGTTTGTIDTANTGFVLYSNGYFNQGGNFNGTQELSRFYGNAGSVRFMGDGDVENTNNSYGALSDIKLKENIVDANSQWNDLKALQVRNYNLKADTGYSTHTQIGLIAQEVELVSPGLVSESPDRDEEGNDLGTTTKSVNYSVLYMKAVKALQEAMERIETLEAKVAALESA